MKKLPTRIKKLLTSAVVATGLIVALAGPAAAASGCYSLPFEREYGANRQPPQRGAALQTQIDACNAGVEIACTFVSYRTGR